MCEDDIQSLTCVIAVSLPGTERLRSAEQRGSRGSSIEQRRLQEKRTDVHGGGQCERAAVRKSDSEIKLSSGEYLNDTIL